MEAIIVKDTIEYRNQINKIDDLYDEDFYKYSDSKAVEFYNETYGVNEVFNNRIQAYLALKKWLTDNRPFSLDVKAANIDLMCYAIDLGQELGIEVKGYGTIRQIKSQLYNYAIVLASAVKIFYLQTRIRHTSHIVVSDKFAVVRHKGAIKKFRKFAEISQERESLYENDSIYRLYPLTTRLKWIVKAYINSFKTYRIMIDFYCPILGSHFKYPLMRFYKKRIVYAELYELLMDDYLSHFKGCNFYTGNNLDRYSVIEDQLCEKYSIKSYNIPHGIEYGFRFPKGFSSDIFYVHSQYTADYLNKLYSTDKYIYDEAIIRRMFEYGYNKPHDQMVIFFTEPRGVNVNLEIINGLLPRLKNEGIPLYLKLHPGDNKHNYDGLDVVFITDYDLSLTGNICISRKSTILIEAIYNHSIPIAIITNPKDNSTFNMFPSLNAKEIVKTYSVEELFDVINAKRNTQSQQ